MAVDSVVEWDIWKVDLKADESELVKVGKMAALKEPWTAVDLVERWADEKVVQRVDGMAAD